MKIRAKQTFQYENDELEEGTVHELPDSVGEQAIEKGYAEKVEEEEETPKIEKPEKEKDTEEVEVEEIEEETSWGEMKEKLDEEPEIPDRWNPPRDDVKSGDISAGDVKDLLGAVKRMDVHRKYDTPFAVVETLDNEEKTVFQQKAIEDLFEEMELEDWVAIRFRGLEELAREADLLAYRYVLCGPDSGETKLSR